MANVMQSLFGLTMPQQQPAAADPLQAFSGLISGTGASLQQNITGAFGQQTPQQALSSIIQQTQQQADLSTPEGLIQLANNLNQLPQFSGIALAMRQEASKLAQESGLTSAKTFQAQAAGTASLAQAMRERTPPALEAADRIRLKELQDSFGEIEGARRFREERDEAGRKQAAAGVPPSGEVKIGDLATAQKIIDDLVGKSKEKLDTVTTAKTFLDQAKRGEGAALPQLKRQLVKLVGDSQIGQGEVRDALGSAGIVGDTINAVNQFMTGVPTKDKLNSVEQVINALENVNAQSYNRGRERSISLLGEAKFSEQTRKTLTPPEYKTGRQKKALTLTGQDKQAYDWAKSNPTDPRSTAILKKLGVE